MAKTLWPKSSSARVDSSLSAHSIMGLVISAILFVVCLSGTVAVFEDELEWWEQANVAPVESVSPAVLQSTAEEVLRRDPETTHLYLYPPRENWPRFIAGGDNGIYAVDENGTFVSPLEANWNEFLVHLHYYLNLPESFGMIIVAIFGVMLVSMAISGLLAHPRIFRDAFRFKRQGQPRLAQADLHNRLSVWTTPFIVAVAGTGAMIGLFTIGALVFAQTNFGGDTRKLSEAIFGGEVIEADDTPAPIVGIDLAVEQLAKDAPGQPPFLVVMHEPGQKSQHIEFYVDETDRLIYGETYTYSTEGELLAIGHNADGPAGQQIAMSMYRVHFGDFGGVAMKLIYFILGLMLCVIIAGGLNIYFLKRREKGRAAPRLEALWSGWVWGSTLFLPVTLIGAILGLSIGWLVAIYWIGSAVCSLAACVLTSAAMAGNVLRLALGAALMLCALIHAAVVGGDWSNPYILLSSVSLFVTGAAFAAWPFLRGGFRPVVAGKDLSFTPGE
ncbi:MAG: PepSY domain-containing protein [Alphaproteobacteria bacterium]|nr:peptidase [Hyphomonas sp.]MBR9807709.1 PepSY domain-containing protein [Alphaproteobacteria bacterium]